MGFDRCLNIITKKRQGEMNAGKQYKQVEKIEIGN